MTYHQQMKRMKKEQQKLQRKQKRAEIKKMDLPDLIIRYKCASL